MTENHLRQAKHYAQDKGLDWVVLTNGDVWEVYRLYYVKKKAGNPEPRLFHLLSTSFTDTRIRPNDRVQDLYLLSKEARRKDELQAQYDLLQVLTPQEMTKRLLNEDVVSRIRIGIKNDIGVNIPNVDLAEYLVSILKDEAIPPNLSYWIKKLG